MNFESLKFYTVNEVAEKLRVSEEFVLGLIGERFLKASKLGKAGVWIVEEQSIFSMLEDSSNMNEKNNTRALNEVDLVEDSSDELQLGISDGGVEEEEVEVVVSVVKDEVMEQEGCIVETSENVDFSNQVKDVGSGKFVRGEVSYGLRELHKNGVLEECVKEEIVVDKLEHKESETVDIFSSNVDKFREDGYMVVNNIRENVIAEFIFDEEQAKKPVEDEIVSKGDFDENVHVCDDQEANEQLLKKHCMGKNV